MIGFVKNILIQFKRYPWFFAVGILALILNIIITWIFADILDWWYLISFILATFITWSVSFLSNSILTFRGHKHENLGVAYIKFIAMYSILSIPVFVIVYILTSILGVHYLISVIIINAPVSLLTFMFNKRVIFSYHL